MSLGHFASYRYRNVSHIRFSYNLTKHSHGYPWECPTVSEVSYLDICGCDENLVTGDDQHISVVSVRLTHPHLTCNNSQWSARWSSWERSSWVVKLRKVTIESSKKMSTGEVRSAMSREIYQLWPSSNVCEVNIVIGQCYYHIRDLRWICQYLIAYFFCKNYFNCSSYR